VPPKIVGGYLGRIDISKNHGQDSHHPQHTGRDHLEKAGINFQKNDSLGGVKVGSEGINHDQLQYISWCNFKPRTQYTS
jgi:hypothetical protein